VQKLYKKLILKRLKSILDEKQITPTHQFGFRNKHSMTDQLNRITTMIKKKTLGGKKVCSTIFLDVAQAFDKVWHEGLFHKIEQLLPAEYSQLLKSCLSDQCFRVKQEDQYQELKQIKAGVLQASVLGLVLYLLHTSDLPQTEEATVATSDDTAIMAVDDSVEEATEKLQQAVDKVNKWTKEWLIKLNEANTTNYPGSKPDQEQVWLRDRQNYIYKLRYINLGLRAQRNLP
jgi:ribosomal protein S20